MSADTSQGAGAQDQAQAIVEQCILFSGHYPLQHHLLPSSSIFLTWTRSNSVAPSWPTSTTISSKKAPKTPRNTTSQPSTTTNPCQKFHSLLYYHINTSSESSMALVLALPTHKPPTLPTLPTTSWHYWEPQSQESPPHHKSSPFHHLHSIYTTLPSQLSK